MSNDYTHIIDLAKEVEPSDNGILTRTLFNNDEVKAVIFGFGSGEELSEHTASGKDPAEETAGGWTGCDQGPG